MIMLRKSNTTKWMPDNQSRQHQYSTIQLSETRSSIQDNCILLNSSVCDWAMAFQSSNHVWRRRLLTQLHQSHKQLKQRWFQQEIPGSNLDLNRTIVLPYLSSLWDVLVVRHDIHLQCCRVPNLWMWTDRTRLFHLRDDQHHHCHSLLVFSSPLIVDIEDLTGMRYPMYRCVLGFFLCAKSCSSLTMPWH